VRAAAAAAAARRRRRRRRLGQRLGSLIEGLAALRGRRAAQREPPRRVPARGSSLNIGRVGRVAVERGGGRGSRAEGDDGAQRRRRDGCGGSEGAERASCDGRGGRWWGRGAAARRDVVRQGAKGEGCW
jgi:hypothetical protein